MYGVSYKYLKKLIYIYDYGYYMDNIKDKLNVYMLKDLYLICNPFKIFQNYITSIVPPFECFVYS